VIIIEEKKYHLLCNLKSFALDKMANRYFQVKKTFPGSKPDFAISPK
jgi:hypothetical protein